jgi:hypothetical protein
VGVGVCVGVGVAVGDGVGVGVEVSTGAGVSRRFRKMTTPAASAAAPPATMAVSV